MPNRTILSVKGEAYIDEALAAQTALQNIMDSLETDLTLFRIAFPDDVYAIERWENDNLATRTGKPLGDVVDALMEGLAHALDAMPEEEGVRERLAEKLMCEPEYCERLSDDEM